MAGKRDFKEVLVQEGRFAARRTVRDMEIMRLAKSLGVEVREIPKHDLTCYQVTVRTKASSCVQVLSILRLHGSHIVSSIGQWQRRKIPRGPRAR